MPDLAHIRGNDAFRFLNTHRIFFYALVSLIGVWAVITNALKNYSNYYSIAIYLSRSSRSVLVGIAQSNTTLMKPDMLQRSWLTLVYF